MSALVASGGSLGLPGILTRTGWLLPETMTQEDWLRAGRLLGEIKGSVQWWIGDWWAFGEHRYGERKALVEAEDWDAPDFQTCMNAASVCRAFRETSRRREVLGFAHHAEVAGLAPPDADALLDWAEENRASTRQLRLQVHRSRNAIGALPSAATCQVHDLYSLIEQGQRFGTIYADPPWLYDNQGTRASTGNHYEGMTTDALCALPITELAADNAHLHLWITNGFLFEAPRIFDAWGFSFRSSFVWVKPQIGIGNYWRNAHEMLLTGIRGDARRFNDHNLRSWIECERGAHSAKPEQVRSMIERASPPPLLELFARWKAPGWSAWGNQIERTLFTSVA